MTPTDVATIAGLFAGPIFGAVVAGWLQDRSESSKRRSAIFRTLMRTRRSRLDPAYVEALNLIEVEFSRQRAVLVALGELLIHYDSGYKPKYEEQQQQGDAQAVIDDKNRRMNDRVMKERDDLFIKLTTAIGVSLGYKLQQLDLMKNAYRPKYFADLETDKKAMRDYVLDLARGKKVLPVAVIDNRTTPASIPGASGS